MTALIVIGVIGCIIIALMLCIDIGGQTKIEESTSHISKVIKRLHIAILIVLIVLLISEMINLINVFKYFEEQEIFKEIFKELKKMIMKDFVINTILIIASAVIATLICTSIKNLAEDINGSLDRIDSVKYSNNVSQEEIESLKKEVESLKEKIIEIEDIRKSDKRNT